MRTITGQDAIDQMRLLRNGGRSFMLWHLTYDKKTNASRGMRHVEHCQLRVALPKEFENGDLYLPYLNLDAKGNQNRFCRKRLVRYVAFPPAYIKMKVNFFLK